MAKISSALSAIRRAPCGRSGSSARSNSVSGSIPWRRPSRSVSHKDKLSNRRSRHAVRRGVKEGRQVEPHAVGSGIESGLMPEDGIREPRRDPYFSIGLNSETRRTEQSAYFAREQQQGSAMCPDPSGKLLTRRETCLVNLRLHRNTFRRCSEQGGRRVVPPAPRAVTYRPPSCRLRASSP
jgi:hypothetical protein